jgi:capsular polysaccharide biosynthesis protein
MKAGDCAYFEPFAIYELADLSCQRLNNIFITYTGLCMDGNGQLLKESHHDYPDQYENFYNEAAFFEYDVIVNPGNLITLDDNQYLLIHHPWLNYFHWITEAVLRLWMVKDELSNMILLLPERWSKVNYVMESLRPFDCKRIHLIPENKSVQVGDLCLPRIKPIVDSYHRAEMAGIKDLYLRYVDSDVSMYQNLGDRIYISRKKSKRRHISNEDAVEETMRCYGFTILCMEELSFFQQAAIFSHARYLVSIHGAGLTNMLFMKQNASVLELQMKQRERSEAVSFAYWYLADVLGHRYYYQFCTPSDAGTDLYDKDLLVDIEELKRNLDAMGSGYK